MDLYALQQTRGGRVHAGGRAWRGPGPGHSRHDDSLSVRIADDGRLHSFAGDGDEPGRAAADKLVSRCRTSPRRLACEIDAAPERQDWNDVLQAYARGRAP